MTVTYNAEVATSKFFTFTKLLFKWRGSTYKILLQDFIFFSFLYSAIALLYHLALPLDSKVHEVFTNICIKTNKFLDWIPLTFVLAFYVSLVIKRWWDMVCLMPWPDTVALKITSIVMGFDDRGRCIRITMMRYINLALVLLLREISVQAKKNFPTMEHVVNADLLRPSDLIILEEIESPDRKFWIPLVWCTALVRQARVEGRITHDYSAQLLLEEINKFREALLRLKNYDWINIPLVYTQVVTIAVYVYFFCCLFARQKLVVASSDRGLSDPIIIKEIHDLKNTEFFYLPVFTILEFFFFMGWLKVAESLVNPFGENDEDLEINWIIDRNKKYGYIMADLLHNQYPELHETFDEPIPPDIPYTVAAMKYKRRAPYLGSTANIQMKGEDAFIVKDVDVNNWTRSFKDAESGIFDHNIGNVRCDDGDTRSKAKHQCDSQSIGGKSTATTVAKSVAMSAAAASKSNIPIIVRVKPTEDIDNYDLNNNTIITDDKGMAPVARRFAQACRRLCKCCSCCSEPVTVVVKPNEAQGVKGREKNRRELNRSFNDNDRFSREGSFSSMNTNHNDLLNDSQIQPNMEECERRGRQHRRHASPNSYLSKDKLGGNESSCSTLSARSRDHSHSSDHSVHSVTQSVNETQTKLENADENDAKENITEKTNTPVQTPVLASHRRAVGNHVPNTSTPAQEATRPKKPMTVKERNNRSRVLNRKSIPREWSEQDNRAEFTKDGNKHNKEFRKPETYQKAMTSNAIKIVNNKNKQYRANGYMKMSLKSNDSMTSAKESGRYEVPGSYTSDVRIRRPRGIRVYDSHTSLTSHHSHNIDDMPRIHRPGRYRTSSSISTWSNVRTSRISGREDASGIGSLVTSQQTDAHGIAHEPVIHKLNPVPPVVANENLSQTAEKTEHKSLENPKIDSIDNVAKEETGSLQTQDQGDLLSNQIPVQDEVNLTAPLVEINLPTSTCNSPSAEKQVKFNLDPQTIIVDPTLPAASTMEIAMQEGVSSASSNVIQSDKPETGSQSLEEDPIQESDPGDEEETDTCSTVSSVISTEPYRSELLDYVYDKKSTGVAILETISECASDVSLTSQSSVTSVKAAAVTGLASKGFSRVVGTSLGSVEEQEIEDSDTGGGSVGSKVESEAQHASSLSLSDTPLHQRIMSSNLSLEAVAGSPAVLITESQMKDLDEAVIEITEMAEDISGGTDVCDEDEKLEKTLKSLVKDL